MGLFQRPFGNFVSTGRLRHMRWVKHPDVFVGGLLYPSLPHTGEAHDKVPAPQRVHSCGILNTRTVDSEKTRRGSTRTLVGKENLQRGKLLESSSTSPARSFQLRLLAKLSCRCCWPGSWAWRYIYWRFAGGTSGKRGLKQCSDMWEIPLGQNTVSRTRWLFFTHIQFSQILKPGICQGWSKLGFSAQFSAWYLVGNVFSLHTDVLTFAVKGKQY